MNYLIYLFIVFGLFISNTIASADSDGHDQHGSEEHEEHENEGVTRIHDDIAQQVNIETATVSSQILKQRISSYGQLTTSPEQLSHVRARFPGLINSVSVNIGDQVKKGAPMASIESNDSLRDYTINSPINGTVIQRHANTGEFTSDQILFSIANFETLWAELRVYPTQRSLVNEGQYIEIKINDVLVTGEIKHLIPVVDQPYQLARVKLDNSQLHLSPGDFVEGHIVVAELKSDLAVTNDAIQTMKGKEGVFIKTNDAYQFTPIRKGRRDDHFTEVLSGLNPNQEYVVKNSYLIKADIEKSEAEHEH
jgi:cobalt-zinc-cadmium efflux system membrane fusion protein